MPSKQRTINNIEKMLRERALEALRNCNYPELYAPNTHEKDCSEEEIKEIAE